MKPCVTMRGETEWTELVESGWNTLANADEECIYNAYIDAVNSDRNKSATKFYGNGDASDRIVENIKIRMGL